ncbi:MAG: DUF3667 domain-containing protein [Chryseotalea sp.]|jgi:hypothetical protein
MPSCINCNAEVTTAYCPACGQPNPPKKISIRNVWSDFVSRTYGFDGMFPRTITDLTIRPGTAAKAYIEGNRVRYYGPIGYFFLMITVYLLLASILGVDMIDYTLKSNPFGVDPAQGKNAINNDINNWVIENFRLISFFIALFSIFYAWLFFRKSGYNIVETSAIVFYSNGHVIWFSILFLLIYVFTGYVFNGVFSFWLAIGFQFYSYVNFYTHQHWFKVLIKSIFGFILSFFLLILCFRYSSSHNCYANQR